MEKFGMLLRMHGYKMRLSTRRSDAVFSRSGQVCFFLTKNAAWRTTSRFFVVERLGFLPRQISKRWRRGTWVGPILFWRGVQSFSDNPACFRHSQDSASPSPSEGIKDKACDRCRTLLAFLANIPDRHFSSQFQTIPPAPTCYHLDHVVTSSQRLASHAPTVPHPT